MVRDLGVGVGDLDECGLDVQLAGGTAVLRADSQRLRAVVAPMGTYDWPVDIRLRVFWLPVEQIFRIFSTRGRF